MNIREALQRLVRAMSHRPPDTVMKAEWQLDEISAALAAAKEALAQQRPEHPTDEQIAEWADSFIRDVAYNRSAAIQIATEAAKWVRATITAT